MDGAPRIWVNRLPLVMLAVMAAGFLALGVAEARSDAPTFDEPVYVSAGLAAVLHHDVTLNDEHPPLPKVLAVLPVLLAHPVVPANGRWSGNDERGYGARFVVAQLAAGKLRSVTFASRLVPLAETAGVAFVLFGIASELSGPLAGALAGMLWLASPLVLGIGHLDGTDVPFALGVTLSSWALLRWLRLRDTRALVWLGLGLAAAAETQVTGLLVAASALAVVIASEWRSGVARALARAGLVGLIAWAVVWAVYIAVDPAMLWQVPMLVPRPYLDGARYLAVSDTSGSTGYVAGIAYTGGRWWFWPLSLVIKWPLTALPLLLAGAVGCLRLPPGPRRRAGLAVGLPAVLLTVLHADDAEGRRGALPAAGARLVDSRRRLRAGHSAERPAGCRAETAGRSGRGHAARRGRPDYRRVVPALHRVDGLAVPAGLRGGHRFRRGLGSGTLRPACLEREPGSVGGLFRAPRHQLRPRSPVPGRCSAPCRLAWMAGWLPR